MKEKRSKKESNKEEAKKETEDDSVLALKIPTESPPLRKDLKIDWTAFICFFNSSLSRYGSVIPPIEWLSKGKKSRVQALVNRWNSKKALQRAVEKMLQSDFLNGRIKGHYFLGSFHWLTESDDHFEKVLNGYYDNPPTAELTPDEQRQLEQERYRAQQAERRAEARRIEEEEHERMARQREKRARGCVSYEEYQRLKQQGLLNGT